MYDTSRGTLLGRVNDIRQMLLDIERLLISQPDSAPDYSYDQARLVSWAHLDTAWSQVYHAWTLIKAEDVYLNMIETT
jgi:hypothetical protein